MTKEQYKAANSKIFPVVMIILGYYLITFLLSILTGNSTWRVWIQIGVSLVAVLVSVFALIKNRETKACSVALMGSLRPRLRSNRSFEQQRRHLCLCICVNRFLTGFLKRKTCFLRQRRSHPRQCAAYRHQLYF